MSDKAPDAWHPGIKSTLPPDYLPLSTLFREENVFTSIADAHELADFTGLPVQQLVVFRPQRLVVHELLIRVSADIFVSDGNRYEDLGINFRAVVERILRTYIEPQMQALCDAYTELARSVEKIIENELSQSLFAPTPAAAQPAVGFSLKSLFGRRQKKPARAAIETVEQRDQRLLLRWDDLAASSDDRVTAAALRGLAEVARAIFIKHGRLLGEHGLLTRVASGIVCNNHGSEILGEKIAPMVERAIDSEGFPPLPPQPKPVVINVKGASASGKSTMRPLQKIHTQKLGINWHEFALISPDIWRKFLLDYDSLGEAYKYAGTLVGDELPIIDQKLDRYIAQKAARGRVSHLLIDRFRFDSFAPGKDTEEGSNLLTRFGHTVYLTFMVTPPEATVERAWLRGLQVGRFKAVDDLLDHNVEAFTGIPGLFFTWALRRDKIVYYEFLDNSVARGEQPRTIAFGLNGEMHILDFKSMFDIVRFARINIEAQDPTEVYPDADKMAASNNTDFLVKCAARLPAINFVERDSGCIYARMESGKLAWADSALLQRMLEDETVTIAFRAMLPNFEQKMSQIEKRAALRLSDEARLHIMGRLS